MLTSYAAFGPVSFVTVGKNMAACQSSAKRCAPPPCSPTMCRRLITRSLSHWPQALPPAQGLSILLERKTWNLLLNSLPVPPATKILLEHGIQGTETWRNASVPKRIPHRGVWIIGILSLTKSNLKHGQARWLNNHTSWQVGLRWGERDSNPEVWGMALFFSTVIKNKNLVPLPPRPQKKVTQLFGG